MLNVFIPLPEFTHYQHSDSQMFTSICFLRENVSAVKVAHTILYCTFSSVKNNKGMPKKDNITIPFNAATGEIIDVTALLANAGYIDDDDDDGPSRPKVTEILQKVQSRMGKIDTGYDEGDGFIDDSDIINRKVEKQSLDPDSFSVALSYSSSLSQHSGAPERSRAKGGEDIRCEKEGAALQEQLQPFIERIRLVTLSPIEVLLDKIASGTTKGKELKITLTPEITDAIGKCIDEKIRLESEGSDAPPGKKKTDQWIRDACQAIYTQCFTVHDYTFVGSIRTIRNAYKKYLNEKKNSENVEPPVKESVTGD